MSWDNKLKRLQENLDLNTEKLANTLGITTRTLADFMKPVSEGGREPTTPVQKLIDLLLGERSQLKLVVIHGDFRLPAAKDVVEAVVEMHNTPGELNNEFHYITVKPDRDAQWASEGLKRRKIEPHFFAHNGNCNSPEAMDSAMDCYFTATTVWLAAQAMRRDLAHITLAADVMKFWPLARELKELAKVEVTFVQGAASEQSESISLLLQNIGISLADPSRRKYGCISSLKARPDSKDISFGFITPGKKENNKFIQEGSDLFFSWNYMHKDAKGSPDIEISKLVKGDYVSFSIGMNNEGACATEVAMVEPVERPDDAQSVVLSSTKESDTKEPDLFEITKDALSVLADEDGWTLTANVGTRLKYRWPDFKSQLKAAGHQGLSEFVKANPDIFEELENGDGKRYKAKCMRLKPTKG